MPFQFLEKPVSLYLSIKVVYLLRSCLPVGWTDAITEGRCWGRIADWLYAVNDITDDSLSQNDPENGGQDDFSVVQTDAESERRLHLQAFDYWHDLKEDREFPLFSELRAEALAPFKANSMLFEFVPAGTIVRFVGTAVEELVGAEMTIGSYLGDFEDSSFARALTEQFSEEGARSRTVEFEFIEDDLNCRGIMLPFSRDGSGAHFVMVVVSYAWLNADDQGVSGEALTEDLDDAAGVDSNTDDADVTILRGLLGAAQSAAAAIVHMDSGNRSSLYDALASALAVYEGAQDNRPAYEALLGEAGLKEQSRAPFTPALKLVFGARYDKTRLTEYAAALSYAVRNGKTSRDITDFLKSMPGGIKGCVQEERAFKRAQAGTPAHNRQKEAEDKLKHLPGVPLKDINPNDEFCLVLTRRKSGGGVEALGCPDVSKATLDRAVRQLASQEE